MFLFHFSFEKRHDVFHFPRILSKSLKLRVKSKFMKATFQLFFQRLKTEICNFLLLGQHTSICKRSKLNFKNLKE